MFARQPVKLLCSWERESHIEDLSVAGCFVSSRAVPRHGQNVQFAVTFDLVPIPVHGSAVNPQPGIGFGVQFGELPADTLRYLHECLWRAARRS